MPNAERGLDAGPGTGLDVATVAGGTGDELSAAGDTLTMIVPIPVSGAKGGQ